MIEKELVTLPGGKEEGFLGDAASHMLSLKVDKSSVKHSWHKDLHAKPQIHEHIMQ